MTAFSTILILQGVQTLLDLIFDLILKSYIVVLMLVINYGFIIKNSNVSS